MNRARLLPIALGLAVATTGAALPAPSAAADACTARGAKVTLQSDQARVFYVKGRGELKRTWYGCLKKSKPIVLTRDVSPRSDEETHTSNTMFRLTGPAVAWVSTSSSDFGAGEFGRSVDGRVLTRGGRHFSVDVLESDVSALAVRADGATAWIRAGEVDTLARDSREPTPLAYGSDVDAAALAIDDAGVHWTQGGTARTAEVRPPRGDAAPAATGPAGPQTIDSSYGDCGVLLPPLPTNIGAGARAIARAPGGTIYAAGGGRYGRGSANILLTRLRPDGTLDTAFGAGGAVSTPVPRPAGSRETDVTGVAVQSDEKVVVSGYVITENANRAFLARFNPDGSLDADFGTGGIVSDALPASQGGQISDVAIAGDGAIVVAGARNSGSARFDPAGDRFVVARYTAGGAPDPAFGAGGVATVEAGRGGRARSIRVTGDKVVAGGQIDEGFALARLNADGSLDGSFGDAGLTRTSPPGSAAIEQLTILSDGRIVAAGTVANILGGSQLALARYDTSGRIDGSFGDGGFAVDRYVGAPGGLIVAGDGRLLVSAGAAFADHNSGAGLVRYTAGGSRDPSFGQSGTLVGFASYGIAPGAILSQADGAVLAAQSYDSNFAVTRYVVGDPALAAAAGGPRACKASVETKSLGQLLRRGKSARYGKLRVVFRRLQPGAVRVGATVRVGSRTTTLGAVTDSSPIAGLDVAEVKVSRSAYALLRKAKQAQVAVTVTGADGGAAATATKTLKR